MTRTLVSLVLLLSARAQAAVFETASGEGWLREVRTGTTDCASALPPNATSRGYTYDGRGNRLTETAGLQTRRFQYDAADRLTAVQEWDGHLEGWALNPDGSRHEEKAWPAGTAWPVDVAATAAPRDVTYEYEAATGGLTSVRNVSTGQAEATYCLDASGRVRSLRRCRWRCSCCSPRPDAGVVAGPTNAAAAFAPRREAAGAVVLTLLTTRRPARRVGPRGCVLWLGFRGRLTACGRPSS